MLLLTMEHMAIFEDTSIHFQIDGQFIDVSLVISRKRTAVQKKKEVPTCTYPPPVMTDAPRDAASMNSLNPVPNVSPSTRNTGVRNGISNRM